MTRRRSIALLVILAVLGLAALRDVARLGDAFPWLQMHDFQDFYCAGEAIDRGSNPYTYEPLHGCEHRVNKTEIFRDHPALAIPAPQPPYDFPPFMALARLGFRQAAVVYAVAIFLMAVLAALCLARTGIPFDVAAIALLLPVAYLEMDAGQVVPFAFLSLAAAGAALAARRDGLAGVFAVLATSEPHFGLPIVIAIFLFAPRARLAAALSAVALIVVGIAVVGAPAAIAYVTKVLPAHASTELAFPYQYSLTFLVHYFGVPGRFAEALADAVYAVSIGLSFWLAARVSRSLQRREMLAFIPAAVAATASPFLHMDELCFAIPAALTLTTALSGAMRTLGAAALCALMVPWMIVWAVKKLFLASVFLCALVLLRLGVAAAPAIAIIAGLAASIYALEFRSPSIVTSLHFSQRFAADDLAQSSWRAFTDGVRVAGIRWILVKVPSWAALITILGVAIASCRKRASHSALQEAAAPGSPLRSRRASESSPAG